MFKKLSEKNWTNCLRFVRKIVIDIFLMAGRCEDLTLFLNACVFVYRIPWKLKNILVISSNSCRTASPNIVIFAADIVCPVYLVCEDQWEMFDDHRRGLQLCSDRSSTWYAAKQGSVTDVVCSRAVTGHRRGLQPCSDRSSTWSAAKQWPVIIVVCS